jgi:UDP-N-acetyl-D-glucosamine dehydrogenase
MKIAVIGQGYVGLTLAVGAASVGHNVIGLDSNSNLVKDLAKGVSFIPGIDKVELRKLLSSGKYIPTDSISNLNGCEAIIIAVPTPLNSDRNPDLRYLELAVIQIADSVQNEALIVNESTSYPGTLRNFIKPLIETRSKVRFLYASAPERIDPGNDKWNLFNTPRVISGLTFEATKKTISLYKSFCKTVQEVSSSEVAEASKLFENTFRQINIALANEFSMISNAMGFSANEAIRAAATKPFGFMQFFPSIGVGGHCIPVDPSYLSYAAEIAGVKAKFIDLANETNIYMTKHIVGRIKAAVGFSLKDLRIQIAGIAYKPGVPDLRESPALLLIKELTLEGATLTWCDPLVGEFEGQKSTDLDVAVDLGLIVTPHKEIDFNVWLDGKTKVFDLSADSNSYGWPKFL